jgi:hypothetical protein
MSRSVDPFEAESVACINELCELEWPSDEPLARAQACIEYAVTQMLSKDSEPYDYLMEAMNEAINHYAPPKASA